MSDARPVYVGTNTGRNGLGLAGFIVSLVGLFTCGFLCPVGVIMCLIALMKPPRGFAGAGLIVGVIGSLIPVVIVLIYGWVFFSFLSCITGGFDMAPRMTAIAACEASVNDVQHYQMAHGALPDEEKGNRLIRLHQGMWPQPLRYKILAGGDFEVRSAGADRTMDTGDDIVRLGSEMTPSTMPWVEPDSSPETEPASGPATGP